LDALSLGRRNYRNPPQTQAHFMPTRECDLNNRPNKTSRYRDAPARTMPNLFARTLRPLNRICRNARAPLAESDFLADRIAFIQSNKVIQQLKASNDEVERRAVASPSSEAALSQSSTPSLASPKMLPRDRSNR
jgi:hypothetical protein